MRHSAPSTVNEFGEPAPGPITDYQLWAEQRGAGSSDAETEGGLLVTAARSYTVRWFEALARASIAEISVIDEFGFTWEATGIGESDARRRYIGIEVVREVT